MSKNKKAFPVSGINENSEENRDEIQSSSDDSMRENGAIVAVCGGYTVQVMTIIGQIEGHIILPPQTKSTK